MAIDINALLAASSTSSTPTAIPKAAAALQQGEGNRRMNSGILGDLFELLSRPSKASAAAVYSQMDDDPNTGVLDSLGQALRGQSEITYKDVAEKAGLDGPAAAIAGFAGDVLLDPLTYVGLKTTKGASLPALEKEAIDNLVKGGAGGITADAVGAELARLQTLNPNKKRIVASFMGKELGGVDVPTALRSTKDAIIGEEGSRRTLAKAFSKKSELPFGLADRASIAESRSAAEYQDFMKGLNDTMVKSLTVDERRQLTEALRTGQTLNVPLQNPDATHPAGFESLEDYRRLARGLFDSFAADEIATGTRARGAYVDNYVPTYFRNPPKDLLPGESQAFGFSTVGPNTVRMTQKNPELAKLTIEDARARGFDPVDDIAELLQIRAAKHFRTVSRTKFLQEGVGNFGVRADDPALADLLKSGELKQRYVRLDEAFGRNEAKRLLGANERAALEEAEQKALTTKVAKGEKKPTVDFPEIYIPKPVAHALAATRTLLTDDSVGSQIMRTYEAALREWKFLNTAAIPGNHIRNSFTDALMNASDGVTNPKYYRQARKILQDAKATQADALLERASLGVEINPGKFERPLEIAGKKMSTRELWELYGKSGSKSGFVDTELFRNMNPLERQAATDNALRGAMNTALRPYDKVKKVVGDFSDTRENLFRLAHFIKALEDEAPKFGKDLAKAAEAAGERVRKYNIDYGDLSSFERRTMNKVIPFYSWMRRNLPLQVEMLFTKPGFMALYPKGQDLTQGLLGADDGEGDFLVPQWIRDAMPARLALADSEKNNPVSKLLQKLAGAGENEGVAANLASTMTPIGDLTTLANPLNALMREGPMSGVQELAGTVTNMITPAIKAPVELATGRSMFTNAEIKDWNTWLLSQVGPSRVGTQVAQGNTRMGTSALFGLQLQPLGEQRQASEFRRREDVLTALRSTMKDRALAERGINRATMDPEKYSARKARVETAESRPLRNYLRTLDRELESRSQR